MPKIHPLAFAVLELRVPFSPRLVSESAIREVSSALADLPVVRPESRQRLDQKDDGSVSVTAEQAFRFLDVQSTRSLIISTAAITYETTHYPGFERFTAQVRECLQAICNVAPPVGFDRLGLRYVNEVRPDAPVRSVTDWESTIAPHLVGALAELEDAVSRGYPQRAEGGRLQTAESTLVFSLPQDSTLTMKLGNFNGPGVVGNAPLRRFQVPEPGPFFVVDFDGSWPQVASEIKPFEIETIIELMSEVHSPVKAAFQWATTPEYREGAGVVKN